MNRQVYYIHTRIHGQEGEGGGADKKSSVSHERVAAGLE